MSMTITVINQQGIWQSTDLRLMKGRQVVDDYSIKHVTFQGSDGIALVAYAGAGSVHNVTLSEWIRHFARGHNHSIGQFVELLRHRASEDLGAVLTAAGLRHMFVIGAFINGVPWSIQVRNFLVDAHDILKWGVPLSRFETSGGIVPAGKAFVVPWPWMPEPRDQVRIRQLATNPLRDPKDFSNVLAGATRRLSEAERTKGGISPYCLTRFLAPNLKDGDTRTHGLPPDAPPIIPPHLFLGMDSTDIFRAMIEDMMAAKKAGQKEGPWMRDLSVVSTLVAEPRNLLERTKKEPGT